MKCVFMYNPYSGKEKVKKQVDFIKARLLEKYDEVDVFASTRAGEMTEKAEEFSKIYDAIVFAGGDGTFNEVIQGVHAGRNVPLGYIPCGTVNDIARSLDIPRNVKGALKNILEGEQKDLDVMQVNDRLVMYSVSAGAFTGCSYQTSHSAKKFAGKIAYGCNILFRNLRLRFFPVCVTMGETVVECDSAFVLFMNSRSVAGFGLNRGAVLDDNQIEAVVVEGKGKTRTFFRVLKVFMLGYKRAKKNKYVYTLEGNEFLVKTSADTVWNFDGECGESGKISIKVLNKYLKVIVPR